MTLQSDVQIETRRLWEWVSAAMNRYSENVAELLLLGRTELADFNEARDSLEGSLSRLEGLIRDEIDVAAQPEGPRRRGEGTGPRRREALAFREY
ncbi:hypothetical protein [Paracoccus siganidrum]|uniref:Uncharacterized protein n=1 Tax=Paracoccus siganidrum TaxID=1276757 RepID=A0A419ABA8_9RHOB|nr:hypothetical protein [Paracoccus siganidrum]RJL20746.1 hypothetical protein D3P05_02585 [Paracoccus siganidrum]RMC31946.1 hypothetical protein C9E82_15490 [Paracoccus siganidrum]